MIRSTLVVFQFVISIFLIIGAIAVNQQLSYMQNKKLGYEKEQDNYKLTVEASYENGEWTGTVYDQWWDELPGANIVVPGSTARTISAEDGTFKLKAEEGHSIVVSFVGYGTIAFVTMFDQPKNWPEVYERVSNDNRPRYRELQH